MTGSGPRIRTPDQRLRVFVSSTLRELAAERRAAQRAIETLRLTPVMFELGARPYPPRALYRAYLEQSHVFVGIYWQSYGWVAPDEQISGLEDEYRLSGSRPKLVYIKGPAPDREDRLIGLLRGLEADGEASYRHFATPEELERLLKEDLMVLLTERFEATGSLPDPGIPDRAVATPPVPLTPSVGRHSEIAEVRTLLAEGCRILTLVGPGGVGKSRLALEVSRQPLQDFPDGVAFVPLETVDESSYAIRVIADRVGARVEGNQSALVAAIDRLRGQRMLLLVDNFEQVLEAGPDLANLLDACPGVSALVTSRRPLRLRGERLLMVEPLGLPATSADGGDVAAIDAALRSPAIALFVERAQRVYRDFEVRRDNVAALTQLVRRLDGLPLAIELVAARSHLLEPEQMLERLEHGRGVPVAAGQDYPSRHRTLRATLDWSHDLLTPPQQTLLARLGVFADGATLETIESVCSGEPVSDLLEDLAVLLDNGLLRADRQQGQGQPRFVLFMTVREFAIERLDSTPEAAAVRDRFVAWALETVALGDPVLHRDAPARWPELVGEARNLQRAAHMLIGSGDCDSFTRMAWGMFHWMWRYGHIGVLARWVERALTVCGDPANVVDAAASARLRAAVSWSRFLIGDRVGALAAQDVLDLEAVAASDAACAALLYSTRAMSLPTSDGGRQAREAAQLSLALAESADVIAVRAYGHAFLASLDLVDGDYASAQEHSRLSVAIATEAGLHSLVGQQHAQLALAAIAQGRVDEGRRLFAAAYETLRVEHNQVDVAFLLGHAAVLATAEGRPGDAARARALSDALMQRLGLVHWSMFEGARLALSGPIALAGPDGVDEGLDADPWKLALAVLRLPEVSDPGPTQATVTDTA